MNRVEQILVKLEDSPWGAFSRILLGFLIVPVASRLLGEGARTTWLLVVFLMGVLFLVRAVPAVLRSVIPFSQSALNLWGRRRGLGKRFDSYQWKKLFWIGLGMLGQVFRSGEFDTAAATVSTLCVGAGTVGWVAWRTVDARLRHGIDAGSDRQGGLAVVPSQSTAQ